MPFSKAFKQSKQNKNTYLPLYELKKLVKYWTIEKKT